MQIFVDLISIFMMQEEKEIAVFHLESLNTSLSILDKVDLDLRVILSL